MNMVANDKKHLKLLIGNEVKLHGENCSLNHIDISYLEDLGYLSGGSLMMIFPDGTLPMSRKCNICFAKVNLMATYQTGMLKM